MAPGSPVQRRAAPTSNTQRCFGKRASHVGRENRSKLAGRPLTLPTPLLPGEKADDTGLHARRRVRTNDPSKMGGSSYSPAERSPASCSPSARLAGVTSRIQLSSNALQTCCVGA
jgi:hypothetical protein